MKMKNYILIVAAALVGSLFLQGTMVYAANVPSAPTGVIALVANESTALVTFIAPVNSGSAPITNYRVINYGADLRQSLVQNNTYTTLPGNTTAVMLKNLQPGRAYKFTVTAYNSYGHSVPSAFSNIITMPVAVVATSTPPVPEGTDQYRLVKVTAPNQSERYLVGQTVPISVAPNFSSSLIKDLTLELFEEGGRLNSTIVSKITGVLSHSWTIPRSFVPSADGRYRIKAIVNLTEPNLPAQVTDTSDQPFYITAATIPTVKIGTFPNGGSVACDSSSVNLSWDYKSTQGVAYTIQLVDISTNVTPDKQQDLKVANPTEYYTGYDYTTKPTMPFPVTPGHNYKFTVVTAARPLSLTKPDAPVTIGTVNFSVPKCNTTVVSPATTSASVTQYTTQVTESNTSGSVPTLNVSVATTTTTKTPTATSGPTSANITIGQTSSGKVLECTVTKANLSWTAQTGEVNYNLRVDDKANVWSGQCGAMNSGDLCWDGYRGVGTVPYVVKSGHTYSFWVDAPSLGQSRRVDFSVASCPNVNILNID